MPQSTPAMITYTPPGGAKQTIKFHAVIAEDHAASSTITKYPVQSGFNISNHSIRENRKISITGVVTNTLLAGGGTAYQYTANNAKTIFDALVALVNSKQPCEVMTNLGIYNPVIFTKFNTKQEAGMTDAIQFTISGEEVQIATRVTGSAPRVLEFVRLTAEEADKRMGILRNTGIAVCDINEISEAKMTTGEDFVIQGKNKFGDTTNTYYTKTGYDSTTDSYQYDVHTDDTSLYKPPVDPAQIPGSGLVSSGDSFISKTGACLRGEGLGVANDFAEDIIDTAMGRLKSSIRGAVYDTMHMVNNEYGQALIKGGIGCVVRGVTDYLPGEGADGQFPYHPGESIPTTDQIMDKAKGFYNSKANPAVPGSDESGFHYLRGEDGAITKHEILTEIKCAEAGERTASFQ